MCGIEFYLMSEIMSQNRRMLSINEIYLSVLYQLKTQSMENFQGKFIHRLKMKKINK